MLVAQSEAGPEAIRDLEDFRTDQDARFGSDARFNLNRRGYNYELYNLKSLVKINAVDTIAISTREPISRMRSAYINKFLVREQRAITCFDQLEVFSKDFLGCVRHTPISHGQKKIRTNRETNTFKISLGSFIEAISVEKQVRLIDAHFKPQLLEEAHFDTITSMVGKVRILPLRTERLNHDLNALNKIIGISYLPAKDNTSNLPPGWELSDSPDSVRLTNLRLIECKVMPSLKALDSWLDKNLQIRDAFMKRFEWDYKLISVLESTEQANSANSLLKDGH